MKMRMRATGCSSSSGREGVPGLDAAAVVEDVKATRESMGIGCSMMVNGAEGDVEVRSGNVLSIQVASEGQWSTVGIRSRGEKERGE